MSEPFQLTEIDHVAIAVKDLDAAVAWYERTSVQRSPIGRQSRATASRRRCSR